MARAMRPTPRTTRRGISQTKFTTSVLTSGGSQTQGLFPLQRQLIACLTLEHNAHKTIKQNKNIRMKSQQFKSLGLVVNLNVPETVEEFDLNAKKSGRALAEAINNVVYRDCLAEFRDNFCEKLESSTSVERKTKDTGKKRKVTSVVDGKEVITEEPILIYAESEAEFVDRVIAEKQITRESLQDLATSVASGIVFDASATERKPAGPKKLAQKYLDDAKKALESGKLDTINARLKKNIGKEFVATGDAEKDVIQMGTLIKEFADWNEAQTRNKLLA